MDSNVNPKIIRRIELPSPMLAIEIRSSLATAATATGASACLASLGGGRSRTITAHCARVAGNSRPAGRAGHGAAGCRW